MTSGYDNHNTDDVVRWIIHRYMNHTNSYTFSAVQHVSQVNVLGPAC